MSSALTERRIRPQNRQKVIVIIDDDTDLREMLCDALSDTGALIKQAGTAETGLATSEMFVVDVIVVDVFMPGKGGIWVMDKLRAQHPNAVIIAMSGGWAGMAPERAVKAAKLTGAHFGFAKPFDLWEVLDLVNDVLDQKPDVIKNLDLAPIKGFGARAAGQV
jgi:DNA-binding NtrC family response regulator